MKDSRSLHLALELAEKDRDVALARCQQAAQALERQRLQAQQLRDYRADYLARWNGQFQRRGTVEIMRCYRDFMARLDQAIAQQALVLQQAQWQHEQARLQLLEQERRAAAIRKLLEKRAAEQALAAQRREQKHTDEQASRLAWNQRADASGLVGAGIVPLAA